MTRETTQAKCPRCQAAARRIYGPFGVLRKGGGEPRADPPTVTEKETPANTAQLINVTTENCGTGLYIGPGASVKAQGYVSRKDKRGIVNEGHFDGPDSRFE